MMDDKKKPEDGKDLREGIQGAVIPPGVPLAGGDPLYEIDSPSPVEPGSPLPEGQATRE